MAAGSVPSSRDSSPACGVISVGARRGSRSWCWLRMVRPSASTSAGRSVASTAASRATASGPVPMPGPATQAWTRPTDPGRSQSPSSGCTVSTASGQACRTTAAGTLAVTTRTMPAPPRTAPPVASTAAPANRSLPASTPTTPRRYLSDSGPGRGSRAAMSSRCGASAAGSPGSGRRPMSTSSTVPACPAPGSMSRPGLITPNVTVTSARTAGPSTAPVSASMPLGRSTATTVAPCVAPRARSAAAARPANGSRRPPRPPMPSRPSMIRSARAMACRRSPVTRPPAARSAAVPPAWAFGPAVIAVTAAPRRASRAPAYSASPPLSPLPASTTTRAP